MVLILSLSSIHLYFLGAPLFSSQNGEDLKPQTSKSVQKIKADSVTETICDICKESLERFWDEQEDDWMLRNVVIGENNKVCISLIYHIFFFIFTSFPILNDLMCDDVMI